ncbi:phospholipase D family protein, partial [Acinetobacter sp. A11]
AYLNTEIGVILDSPSLAKTIHHTMDENLNKYAYKLKLDTNNHIYWQQETPNGPVIYRQEPEMKWWQKAGMKFLSWLPLEGFM